MAETNSLFSLKRGARQLTHSMIDAELALREASCRAIRRPSPTPGLLVSRSLRGKLRFVVDDVQRRRILFWTKKRTKRVADVRLFVRLRPDRPDATWRFTSATPTLVLRPLLRRHRNAGNLALPLADGTELLVLKLQIGVAELRYEGFEVARDFDEEWRPSLARKVVDALRAWLESNELTDTMPFPEALDEHASGLIGVVRGAHAELMDEVNRAAKRTDPTRSAALRAVHPDLVPRFVPAGTETRLLARLDGKGELVTKGGVVPQFDLHARLERDGDGWQLRHLLDVADILTRRHRVFPNFMRSVGDDLARSDSEVVEAVAQRISGAGPDVSAFWRGVDPDRCAFVRLESKLEGDDPRRRGKTRDKDLVLLQAGPDHLLLELDLEVTPFPSVRPVIEGAELRSARLGKRVWPENDEQQDFGGFSTWTKKLFGLLFTWYVLVQEGSSP